MELLIIPIILIAEVIGIVLGFLFHVLAAVGMVLFYVVVGICCLIRGMAEEASRLIRSVPWASAWEKLGPPPRK